MTTDERLDAIARRLDKLAADIEYIKEWVEHGNRWHEAHAARLWPYDSDGKHLEP